MFSWSMSVCWFIFGNIIHEVLLLALARVLELMLVEAIFWSMLVNDVGWPTAVIGMFFANVG